MGSQGDSAPWFAGSPASLLLSRLLASVRASLHTRYLVGRWHLPRWGQNPVLKNE